MGLLRGSLVGTNQQVLRLGVEVLLEMDFLSVYVLIWRKVWESAGKFAATRAPCVVVQ
jgi:hypothetical protein